MVLSRVFDTISLFLSLLINHFLNSPYFIIVLKVSISYYRLKFKWTRISYTCQIGLRHLNMMNGSIKPSQWQKPMHLEELALSVHVRYIVITFSYQSMKSKIIYLLYVLMQVIHIGYFIGRVKSEVLILQTVMTIHIMKVRIMLIIWMR